jgi:hypothetical protein
VRSNSPLRTPPTNVTSDAYIEDTDATRRYASIFDHLLATARSPADSAELFAKVAKEL